MKAQQSSHVVTIRAGSALSRTATVLPSMHALPSPADSATTNNTTSATRTAQIEFAIAGVAIALLVVAVIVRLRLAALPLERDEGEYAYIAQRLLLGEAPFVGSYTMKFPGVALLDAMCFATVGHTATAVRLGLLVQNAIAVGGIGLLVYRQLGRVPALVAAAVCAAALVNMGVQGLFAHATHAVVACVIVGTVLLSSGLRRRRLVLVLGAGTALGTAVLMKQHAALFIPGALLAIGFSNVERRRIPAALGACVVGVALPMIVVVGWLALHGAFAACWFWTVTQARAYIAMSSLSTGASHLLKAGRYMAPTMWSLWLLAAAGCVVVIVRRERWWCAALGGSLVLSFLATCPGLFFRPHYFVVVAPVLAVCAAVFTARAMTWTTTPRLLAGALTIAALVAPWVAQRHLLTAPVAAITSVVDGDGTFTAAVAMAEAIAHHHERTNTIAVFGSEPELLFLAQRRSATGYLYMYPLMEPHPHTSAMQQQLIDEVTAADPADVVVVATPLSWLQRPDSPPALHTWLQTWLDERYALIEIVDLDHVERGVIEPPPQAPQRFMAHYVRR